MAGISKQALRKEIAAILKGADLDDTSAKNVRLQLEEKLDCKLISRKKEIDELVMEYVSKAADKKGKKDSEGEEDEEEEEEGAENDKPSEEEEDEEEEEESEEEKKPAKRTSAAAAKKPAPKRAKKDASDSDASEGSGDGSEDEYVPEKKAAPKQRGRKPAAAKKKKGSDSDGDEDWVQEKASPRKSSGGGGGPGKGKGYTKQLTLSPELAALVGQEMMARHEVVKKMWSIIKERNLYDPKNKQFAICDEALQKVIGVKRFRMFGMMKYLKSHFIA